MFRATALVFFAIMVGSFAVAQDQQKLVKLVTVEASDAETTRQFFGHVVAKQTVDLAFQVGGQIVEIPIIEGQTIAEGALIAKLDLEPFELELDQAQVQKEQADRTLERSRSLQGNAVSQVTVDDAETDAKLAEIALRNAERSLRHAELRAPFDALVASRNLANFSTIDAGTAVARLHDMSELRIEIDVPEILFQRAGRDADVALFAEFPSSNERFPLQTQEFNAEASEVGQTFKITLSMTPPEDLAILPGASVTVFATLRNDASSMRIPPSAVTTTNDGATQAMVFSPESDGQGTVAAVPISIKPAPDGTIEVLDGLEMGQEIVASGANLLSDGERVMRFVGFAD